MKQNQYKITIRGTDISLVYSGETAEEAFCNMFRDKVSTWRQYSRDAMLSYMEGYSVEEIAGNAILITK